MSATKEDAIQKIRKLAQPLPLGTVVLCKNWLQGRIDGMTVSGKYIVVLDQPVEFPTINLSVQVVAFDQDVVKEIK